MKMTTASNVAYALKTFEGIACAFVGERHSKTLNHVVGYTPFARRCGATPSDLTEAAERAIRSAYKRDPGRVKQLREFVRSLEG